MTVNILPCPMCGADSGTLKKVKGGYIVCCELSTPLAIYRGKETCDVGNVTTDVYPTPDEAISNWNWRIS